MFVSVTHSTELDAYPLDVEKIDMIIRIHMSTKPLLTKQLLKKNIVKRAAKR